MTELFERLRRETRPAHDAVEARVRVAAPDVTVDDVRTFLTALWRVHHAIEAQLARVPDLATAVPDLARRRKAPRLAADLAALGVDVTSQPPAAVPSITTLAQALGALYVLEGSTLGGRVIHRHLAATLPEVARTATSFLTVYDDTGAMWHAFQEHVSHAAAPRDHDAIVATAGETFAAVQRAFGADHLT